MGESAIGERHTRGLSKRSPTAAPRHSLPNVCQVCRRKKSFVFRRLDVRAELNTLESWVVDFAFGSQRSPFSRSTPPRHNPIARRVYLRSNEFVPPRLDCFGRPVRTAILAADRCRRHGSRRGDGPAQRPRQRATTGRRRSSKMATIQTGGKPVSAVGGFKRSRQRDLLRLLLTLLREMDDPRSNAGCFRCHCSQASRHCDTPHQV